MDRRSVLIGLGAAAFAAGCAEAEDQAPAAPAAPPPPEPLDLSELEARLGGRLGLAAQDLATGRRLSARGEERFNYCSTFKLFLAAATLQRVQRGEERLDRAIAVTRADMVHHAPVTETAIGGTLTIEQLCKATVELSDNPAANLLIREYGGIDAFRGWYRSIGDASTTVDRLEPMMNRKDGDKDTIQPTQAVANLITVLTGDTPLLAGPQHQLLKQWLIDTPTGQDRIKSGAPAGWTVAHKTGTGGTGQTNDIGVLYPPSGAPVVLAIYFEGPAGASTAQRERVIADATRLALRALGHG